MSAHGESLPSGFQDSVVFDGLDEPTALRFSSDGRVFVAEKSGVILVYDSFEDEIPAKFADLRAQVYDSGDRGLLGLALDPDFPAKPFVYALYTFDHVIGEDAPGDYPRWGQPPNYVGDPCPKPPDADVDACPVSGRLVRLTAEGSHAAGEKVLVEDWCQQTSSHSIGDLEFGPEGALFASGGDGASFSSSDFGQFGWPQKNQCGDPPDPVGVALEPPESEGGSLRSQDLRTLADPTGLDGAVIRVDPQTGAGLPDNPLASSSDANARRIVAFGFRNPFRLAIDAETDEVYVDNVGNGTDEEIDRFSTTPSTAYNSGWPCFEGAAPNPGFQDLGLTLCEDLYDEPGSTSVPFFSYVHGQPVTPEDTCPSFFGSAISGSAFYGGDAFPASYDNAFFFADPIRSCIYAMFAGKDGRPDPSTTTPFLTDGGLYPGVDIQMGPEGALFYAKLFGDTYDDPGSIHRISYFSGNQPPVARLTASPQWGASPLNAQFDATNSSDADGEALQYEWDLQGDGTYEGPTANGKKSKSFSDSKNHTVAVRVKDGQGASSVARVTVYPGDTPPDPTILTPEESEAESGQASLHWRVGEHIDFEGEAKDLEDGQLATTDLGWSSRLYHCPSACHAHPLQAFPSVGSGTLVAPDHDYPSYLELTLEATDQRGLSAARSIRLDPRTVQLEIGSEPAGVRLTAGLRTEPAPFALTAIEGSHITLSAPLTAQLGGLAYAWKGWSDGGARVHTIVADDSAQYTAAYSAPSKSLPAPRPAAEPRAVLKMHPEKRTRRRIARFEFGGNEPGMRFRCRIDDRPFRPCQSPRVYRHLKPGRHAFRVIAVDTDDNASLTPTIFRWKVL